MITGGAIDQVGDFIGILRAGFTAFYLRIVVFPITLLGFLFLFRLWRFWFWRFFLKQ